MPRPRPLTDSEAKRVLAQRLSRAADRLRQFSTRFGLRSKRVFMVWTKYTGDERGAGREQEIKRVELLPTPRVGDGTGVMLTPYSAGVLPVGMTRVDLISAKWTREELRGKIPPASQERASLIEEPYDFFWEIVDDKRMGGRPTRRKFRVVSLSRDEGNVCWSVTLERVSEDRTPEGLSGLDPSDGN